MQKRRRKRPPGRPATGQDPVIPVRLPTKLIRDIDAWAAAYWGAGKPSKGMSRSTAIRCLLVLGMERVSRVVDPKTRGGFEIISQPLPSRRRGARKPTLKEVRAAEAASLVDHLMARLIAERSKAQRKP